MKHITCICFALCLYLFTNPTKAQKAQAGDTIKVKDKVINFPDSLKSKDIVVEYDTIYIPGDTIRYVDTMIIYVERPRRTDFSAELYYTSQYFHPHIEPNYEEYADYAKQFKKTLATLPSHGIGGALNIHFDNWFLQLGMAYTPILENFSHSIFETRYDSIMIESIIFEDLIDLGNGKFERTVVTKIESSIDTIITEYPYTDNNYLNILEFPFAIGYSIDKYKLSYSFKLGGTYSMVKDAGGSYITVANDTVSKFIDDNLSQDINLSLQASVGFYYRLNQHSKVFCEPYCRYFLKSIYKNDFPIVKNYSSLGIKIGYKYIF